MRPDGVFVREQGAVRFEPRLARLCGYGARPALSHERLSALPDGRLAIRLKRPLADGRLQLELEPVELLCRLATLVPPPRAHVTRFHGVFGPASTTEGPLEVAIVSSAEAITGAGGR